MIDNINDNEHKITDGIIKTSGDIHMAIKKYKFSVINNICNIFKQFFCRHEDIRTTTESYSPENCFIVKSLIQCSKCEKTFAQHPNEQCCYIMHIHAEVMRDFWINKYKSMQQAIYKE